MSSSVLLVSQETHKFLTWRSAVCRRKTIASHGTPVSHFCQCSGPSGAARAPSGLGSGSCWSAPAPMSAPPVRPRDPALGIPMRSKARSGVAWPGPRATWTHQNELSSFPLLCHHARRSGISNFFPPRPQQTVAAGDVAPGREPPSAHHRHTRPRAPAR